MIKRDIIDEVVLQEWPKHLRIAAVRINFNEIPQVFNLGTQFINMRHQRGLSPGKYNRVQERAPFFEKSYLIRHATMLREGEIGIVAIGATQIATVVPKNTGSLLRIVQEGERRDIRRMNGRWHEKR